jgi:hypothetical protein
VKNKVKVIRRKLWGVFWRGLFYDVYNTHEGAEIAKETLLKEVGKDDIIVRPVIVEWREGK